MLKASGDGDSSVMKMYYWSTWFNVLEHHTHGNKIEICRHQEKALYVRPQNFSQLL